MPAPCNEAVHESPLAAGNPGGEIGPILVAEDDPLYRHALQHFLTEKGYAVQLVGDGLQALELALSPQAPRLLVLDWMMPGISGPEICRRVRATPREHYQYVLLLTAKRNTSDIVEGLEAGADDYLTKPFNVRELFARIRVGERIIKLQDSLFAAQEGLRFQATHDALTGIWNRGALFDLLHAEVERAQRKATSLSLFLIDLDHFKCVNDEYGHPIGDIVLQQTAQRLSTAVRAYDIVGRYGGEEFIIAAAELEPELPQHFADRLRLAVSSSPVHTAELEIAVTISVGVATIQGAQNLSLERLIRCADRALYEAKRKGRNQVCA